MSIDGFLTFVGLLVAAYAIVPDETKLRMRVGMWLQIAVALMALASVLYFEFLDVLEWTCPSVLGAVCARITFSPNGAFSPQDAAFLVVLFWALLAFLIHKFVRPGAEALPGLARHVDRLARDRKYGELLTLVEPFLPTIARASWRRLPAQALRDRLEGWRNRGRGKIVGLLGKDREPEPGKFAQAVQRQIGRTYRIAPAQRGLEEAAKDIARLLYSSEPLRTVMARERPNFAIELMRTAPWGGHDFEEGFFGQLIRDPGSILYDELRQTEALDQTGAFKIPASNRLLRFLFDDAKVAARLRVWKPIGDYMLDCARKETSNPFVAELNRPVPADFDETRWRNPIWTGMWFFDVMVRAAAVQGVQNDMWLMYYRPLVEHLVAIYDPSGPDIDQGDEFPTIGARLIAEAFDHLGTWLHFAVNVSPGWRDAGVVTCGPDRHIPTAAAETLAYAIAAVATDDNNLGDELAETFHTMLMRDLDGLGEQRPGAGDLRAFVIGMLVRGWRGSPPDLQRRLAHLYAMSDDMLRADLRDYAVALGIRD